MSPKALPARPPMNFKKQSLYEDQTDQAIGRAGEQARARMVKPLGMHPEKANMRQTGA